VQIKLGGSEEDPAVAPTDESSNLLAKVRVDQPFPMAVVTTQTAQQAYDSVLAGAGATLPHRDPVDLRILDEVRTGNVTYEAGKGIITDIAQVGGYPEYKGQPATDLDSDGLPRWWKAKYGLDSKDLSLAAKDLKGDGYTVFEKYLDGLDPAKKIDWTDPKSNENALSAEKLRPPQR
jgi:hypothetical protein